MLMGLNKLTLLGRFEAGGEPTSLGIRVVVRFSLRQASQFMVKKRRKLVYLIEKREIN